MKHLICAAACLALIACDDDDTSGAGGAGGAPMGGAGGEGGMGAEGGEGGEGGGVEATCESECGRLGACAAAADSCPGITDANLDDFVAGCIDTCNGMMSLLALTQSQAECDGVIGTVSNVSPDFAAACEGGAGGMGGGEFMPIEEPETYAFDNRFGEGSSVSYSGQVKRHVLVEELKAFLGGLTDETFENPQEGDVKAAILFYVDFADIGSPDYELQISSHLPLKQPTMGDLGSLANLREKMPDQDAGWEGPIVGYGDGLSPTEALEDMAQKVEDEVLARFAGNIPMDPTGAPITAPYISGAGVDYQQLIQKYLTGAIFYSQAADDYMDDDLEGKGLLSDNTAAVVKNDVVQVYSGLEHVWDEGFGYFGATRNFDAYTDDEIAKKGGRDDWQGAHDTDGDGTIDLKSEFVFGASANAAKRDRGSMSGTDFTQAAFDAFIKGRTLIYNANGALSEDQLSALREQRDIALKAWEDAIAATVVHYINDVLQDMGKFGTEEYNFTDHAKHWAEMKGFALALQFNVNHSSWEPQNYARLHVVLGDAPVLPNADPADIMRYMGDMQEAKAIIAATQGFDMADLGDAQGMNGW